MKTLFLSASAIAAASLLTPSAFAAPAAKTPKPAAEAAAAMPAPGDVEDAPMTSAQPAAMPAPAASPAPDTDAAATTPADTTAPAQTASAPAAPTDPASILRTEFPVFDADKSGELSNAEFATWMTALRKNSGQTLTPEQQTTWMTQSFAQADTSKNGTIALDELTKFLVKG